MEQTIQSQKGRVKFSHERHAVYIDSIKKVTHKHVLSFGVAMKTGGVEQECIH